VLAQITIMKKMETCPLWGIDAYSVISNPRAVDSRKQRTWYIYFLVLCKPRRNNIGSNIGLSCSIYWFGYILRFYPSLGSSLQFLQGLNVVRSYTLGICMISLFYKELDYLPYSIITLFFSVYIQKRKLSMKPSLMTVLFSRVQNFLSCKSVHSYLL
jgi:hypothetical protein